MSFQTGSARSGSTRPPWQRTGGVYEGAEPVNVSMVSELGVLFAICAGLVSLPQAAAVDRKLLWDVGQRVWTNQVPVRKHRMTVKSCQMGAQHSGTFLKWSIPTNASWETAISKDQTVKHTLFIWHLVLSKYLKVMFLLILHVSIDNSGILHLLM